VSYKKENLKLATTVSQNCSQIYKLYNRVGTCILNALVRIVSKMLYPAM